MHSIFQPQLRMHRYPRYHCRKVVSGQFLVSSITYTLFVFSVLWVTEKRTGYIVNYDHFLLFARIFEKRKTKWSALLCLLFSEYTQCSVLFITSVLCSRQKVILKNLIFLLQQNTSQNISIFYKLNKIRTFCLFFAENIFSTPSKQAVFRPFSVTKI